MAEKKSKRLNKKKPASKKRKKRILVTGGAGYIGSVLVPMLLSDGHFVKVVDALIYNQKTPTITLKNNNYKFIKGDLLHDDVLKEAVSDVDFIIHLAALVGEVVCRENPGLSYEINTLLVEKINQFRKNLPIIIMSTTSIYGETGGGICTENSDPGPYLPYALNKLGAEKIIRKSKDFIILRPATAFGCSPRPRLDLLPNDFTFRVVKKGRLDLFNPDIYRTFIYVSDLARIIKEMMENFDVCKNNIFNAGSNELNFSKRELAEVIKSKIDYDLKVIEDFNDPDKRNFIVNYDKIKSAINYEPTYDLNRGIDELIAHYTLLEDDIRHYNHTRTLDGYLFRF